MNWHVVNLFAAAILGQWYFFSRCSVGGTKFRSLFALQ